mmetsp:Transcript_126047/g.368322  ORF Transcript_126047/g.368322 Transcript_126047/m.368322 type:complete len:313 (-) Transcript_126047:392-1330(-)
MTSQELESLPVRDLKARLRELGCTDFSQFVERSDLIRALSSSQPGSVQEEPLVNLCVDTPPVGSAWASSSSSIGPTDGNAEREVEIGDGFRVRVAEQRSAFDNSNTGAVLWDASVRLARYVVQLGRCKLAGKHVIELGCGTGLAGLAAGMQGAHVTLTDLQEVLSQTTEANLEANLPALRKPGGAAASTVKLQPLAWGGSVDHLDPRPPFDYILAADIVYKPELFEPLKQTLLQLSGAGTRVLLSYTRRRSQEEWFFSSLCEDFHCSVVGDACAAPTEGGEGHCGEDGWRSFRTFGESAIFLLVRRPGGSSL